MKIPSLSWSLLLALFICLAHNRLRARQAATCQPLGCCRGREKGRDSCWVTKYLQREGNIISEIPHLLGLIFGC